MGWERVEILTDGGPVPGVAPVILSASRATDLPAFYGEWFSRRLAAGYLARVNPRNPRQRRFVSFEKARVVVFWSKNPAPLERHLERLDERGIGYYFAFTVNDYERERLEPGLPPLEERLATFRRLARRLGPDRVVWRFDPILAGGGLGAERLLERIAGVGERLHPETRKLVISFADIVGYRGVRGNLARAGRPEFVEPAPAEVLRIAEGIARLNRRWGLEVGSCAEKIDLSAFGIGHNRCVDGELMARLFPRDEALLAFLGRGGGGAPALFPGSRARPASLKDRGQRRDCGCIVSQDVGRYSSCPHHCAYCYANSSPAAADAALAWHRADGEGI